MESFDSFVLLLYKNAIVYILWCSHMMMWCASDIVIIVIKWLQIIWKKRWHNIVWGSPIDQAGSVIFNKPAGDAFPTLHIPAEVLLPVSVEEFWKKTMLVGQCVCMQKKRSHPPSYMHYVCVSVSNFRYITWSHWVFVPSHTYWHHGSP